MRLNVHLYSEPVAYQVCSVEMLSMLCNWLFYIGDWGVSGYLV
jgi:hypothetical protein